MKNIDENDLIIKLKDAFEKWKNEKKFKSSFEDLDEVFFITDYVLASGFISPKINRMICGRLKDTLNGWVQQIHYWIIPAPYSIISTSESHLFDEKEKEELKLVLKDFMSIVSLNVEVGLTKDAQKEAEYVDNALGMWRKHLPSLIKFSKKVRVSWQEGNER